MIGMVEIWAVSQAKNILELKNTGWAGIFVAFAKAWQKIPGRLAHNSAPITAIP